MADVIIEKRELLFAVEGVKAPQSLLLEADLTVAGLLERVRHATGRHDLVEALIEDEETALAHHELVFERITIEDFRLIHVASCGEITVTVAFNGVKQRTFKPSATMAKIIRWAMYEFGIEGDPSEFQLKVGDAVLPPGEHLGQVAHGAKEVRLALVMKIRPQG